MRNICALLTLLLVIAIPNASHADTITYGPITLGSNAPFGDAAFYPQYSVFVAVIPSLSLFSPNGSDFVSGSISFTYDLAPGWQVGGILVNDFTDFGATQTNWAIAYFQEVVLCPSTAPGNCTNGAITQYHSGPAPLPSEGLTPNAAAGPGTGIYEYAEYADNAQFGPNGLPGITIHLIPSPSPVPEPSTFLLLGSGAIGLLTMAKRRMLR